MACCFHCHLLRRWPVWVLFTVVDTAVLQTYCSIFSVLQSSITIPFLNYCMWYSSPSLIWALSFLRASSVLVNFVFNRCWDERHQIQPFRAKCDAVGLICGSSPLTKGPHWTWGLVWTTGGSACARLPKNLRWVVQMMCVSGGWSIHLQTSLFEMQSLQKIAKQFW